jgi:tetratricopeptide (TPR) repeat protein
MMPPRVTNSPYAEEQLRKMIEGDSNDWEARKTFARFLYDRGDTNRAAELIWEAPEIPSVDFEIAFAARILAKGTPRRAIRLLNAVLEQNKGRAVQNLGLANALLHHGMVMQAARFYGAAIESDKDGDIVNADLEHFLLWTDDHQKIWGDFEQKKDELDELPWMVRSAKEAEELRQSIRGHTTPVRVKSAPPINVLSLPPIPIETPKNPMYVQSPYIGDKPTPPPAVTIPMDRVAAKDRVFDESVGAEIAPSLNDRGALSPSLNPSAPERNARKLPRPAPTTRKPTLNKH